MKEPKDCRGNTIRLNNLVAVGANLYRMDGAYVQVRKVTKIVDQKVYLDDSRVPRKFNDRICVLRAVIN